MFIVEPAQVMADMLGEFQGPKNQVEESLLHACSKSDVSAINTAISKKDDTNFQCVDILGRTPLQLAIANKDIEVTRLLLPYSDNTNIENCLLFAISLSNENLAMAILSHPRYLEIENDDNQNQEKFPTESPLVLAADKNLYKVVRHLLAKGKTICDPPELKCLWPNGVSSSKEPHKYHPRFSLEMLNAYRGLASESYISLSSPDPIHRAFQLRQTLLKHAASEEHFKAEYTDLAKNLSAFSVKLLDKVICDEELNAVFNTVGSSDEDPSDKLGRLTLAVKFREKRFVAHPWCQMRLNKLWYKDFETLNRGCSLCRFGKSCVFCLCYVFLALVYLVAPNLKVLRFMRSPCAKYLANVLFYLILLAMLLFSTIKQLPYRVETDITWASVNNSKYFRIEPDGAVLFRNDETTAVHYLIFIWVVGLLWQEIKEFYRDGWKEYISSFLNCFHVTIVCVYFASYVIRFYSNGQVKNSTYYFKEGYLSNVNSTIYQSPIDLLDARDETALGHYIWVNPDRFYWDEYDCVNIYEALFAIANVLDFVRFAALLPVFEGLGTLQISARIMIMDVLRFMAIFLLVFLAFMVGLTNLYWFYAEVTRKSVELEAHPAPVAEAYFGNITLTFLYCLWSVFGMGEMDANKIDAFQVFNFTQNVGYFMYAFFLVSCVVVLLNMLIAMMSLTFSKIHKDADVEWKFSRAQLFLAFIKPGATLPVPLNIIPSSKSVSFMFRSLFRCFCKRENIMNCVNAASVNLLNDKYKSVISRLVGRFISDSTSSQDDDNDDDNLKTDRVIIKRDVVTGRYSFKKDIMDCKKAVGNLEESVQSLTTIITQMKAEMNQSSSSPVGQVKPAPLEQLEPRWNEQGVE